MDRKAMIVITRMGWWRQTDSQVYRNGYVFNFKLNIKSNDTKVLFYKYDNKVKGGYIYVQHFTNTCVPLFSDEDRDQDNNKKHNYTTDCNAHSHKDDTAAVCKLL